MKTFEFPEILVIRYGIEDVITTSVPNEEENPTVGKNDLGWI